MAGLVLTRKVGEKIRLQAPGGPDGPAIWIELDSINGSQVRLRILAPDEVVIQRGEHVFDRPSGEGPPAFESVARDLPALPSSSVACAADVDRPEAWER